MIVDTPSLGLCLRRLLLNFRGLSILLEVATPLASLVSSVYFPAFVSLLGEVRVDGDAIAMDFDARELYLLSRYYIRPLSLAALLVDATFLMNLLQSVLRKCPPLLYSISYFASKMFNSGKPAGLSYRLTIYYSCI